jgi:beta-glucanase (GH16 family)
MSGRIESKQTIKPLPGHITMAEAVIRFGNDSTFHKQGVWPAFWLLGSSNREPGGKKWPMCGEIDIMETKNGEAIAYNTVHCDQPTGGLCAEPKGITQSINMTTSQSWHTWRVEWDLTSTEMETQSITWYRDGESSFSLTGWDIPSEEVWRSLTQNSLYFILNVAIGGTFVSPSLPLTYSSIPP